MKPNSKTKIKNRKPKSERREKKFNPKTYLGKVIAEPSAISELVLYHGKEAATHLSELAFLVDEKIDNNKYQLSDRINEMLDAEHFPITTAEDLFRYLFELGKVIDEQDGLRDFIKTLNPEVDKQ